MVTLEYVLPGTTSEISTYFSNFQLFGKYHPYMIEVTELENTSTSIQKYHVRESLTLWNFIPMKPSYDVEVCILEPEKHICYQSEVHKGVFLEINYTFIEDLHTNTVKVLEAMVVKGYPIINPIFIGILKRSRILLIESIREAQTKKYALS